MSVLVLVLVLVVVVVLVVVLVSDSGWRLRLYWLRCRRRASLGIASGSLAEADEEQRTTRELAAEIGRLLAGIKRSLRRLPPPH